VGSERRTRIDPVRCVAVAAHGGIRSDLVPPSLTHLAPQQAIEKRSEPANSFASAEERTGTTAGHRGREHRKLDRAVFFNERSNANYGELRARDRERHVLRRNSFSRAERLDDQSRPTQRGRCLRRATNG